jgi:hypothetical protein
MTPLVTMRRALSDEHLLRIVLGGDSWLAWRILLIAAMGEALTDDERAIFAKLTGREREPGERVDELWCVIGRRGGKSRAVAALLVYLATMVDYCSQLVLGERGLAVHFNSRQRFARTAHITAGPAVIPDRSVKRGGSKVEVYPVGPKSGH